MVAARKAYMSSIYTGTIPLMTRTVGVVVVEGVVVEGVVMLMGQEVEVSMVRVVVGEEEYLPGRGREMKR